MHILQPLLLGASSASASCCGTRPSCWPPLLLRPGEGAAEAEGRAVHRQVQQ